jgi:hypothetical protein
VKRSITTSSLGLVVLAACALALAVAPAALSDKGGNGGGGKPGGGGSSSVSLVLLDSTDGLPHYGQQVTFAVSTTATDRPYVSLNCYQNGVWVYSDSAGFFPDYPWSQIFVLSTLSTWTSGAGDCTATLYLTKDGSRSTTLATLSFHVYA